MTERAPADGSPSEPQSTSALLRVLAGESAASIPIGKVAAAAGSKAHGLAIFLLALPEAIPLPLPSASAILGIPLVVISGHLMLFGEETRLPRRIETIEMPRSVITGLSRYAGPVLNWLEHVSHPRWLWVVGYPRTLGGLCLYLSLLLLAPLPLFNLLPALCLAALALGTMQRDGIVIAAGMLGAVLTTAALLGLVDLGTYLLSR